MENVSSYYSSDPSFPTSLKHIPQDIENIEQSIGLMSGTSNVKEVSRQSRSISLTKLEQAVKNKFQQNVRKRDSKIEASETEKTLSNNIEILISDIDSLKFKLNIERGMLNELDESKLSIETKRGEKILRGKLVENWCKTWRKQENRIDSKVLNQTQLIDESKIKKLNETIKSTNQVFSEVLEIYYSLQKQIQEELNLSKEELIFRITDRLKPLELYEFLKEIKVLSEDFELFANLQEEDLRKARMEFNETPEESKMTLLTFVDYYEKLGKMKINDLIAALFSNPVHFKLISAESN